MIRYLAIGDSLTVGFGALPSRGWVSRYRAETERLFRRPVVCRKAAKIGATSGEVLRMITRMPGEWIARADIITITAGGNDLIRAAVPIPVIRTRCCSGGRLPDVRAIWNGWSTFCCK